MTNSQEEKRLELLARIEEIESCLAKTKGALKELPNVNSGVDWIVCAMTTGDKLKMLNQDTLILLGQLQKERNKVK